MYPFKFAFSRHFYTLNWLLIPLYVTFAVWGDPNIRMTSNHHNLLIHLG